jgi:hypothetical protein
MKDEILDDIFEDNIYRSLEKHEKVIWDGKPQFSSSTWGRSITSLILRFSVVGLILFWLFGGITFLFLLFLILIFQKDLIKYISKYKNRYLITDQRIIFQLWDIKEVLTLNWKRDYLHNYSIPFSEINNIIIVEENKTEGVIFLAVKNPTAISFETYNLNNGEKRHQPTLEMIENVEEVGNYIRQGIQKKL